MTNISRYDGRIPTNDPLWAFLLIAGLLAALTPDQAQHIATAIGGAAAALEAARLLHLHESP